MPDLSDAVVPLEAEPLRPFFFDVAEIPGYTIADIFGGADDAEHYFALFGA